MTPVTFATIVGSVNLSCQVPEPIAVGISGPAGSGKSSLGRALAGALSLPILDLDTATNPLLDALPPGLLDDNGHWLASKHMKQIREGRYATLGALAAEILQFTRGVVLVAPFTAELQKGPEWERLVRAIRPARLKMFHISGDEELFERRRARRGETRDKFRSAFESQRPAAPAIDIDAYLSTDQQLCRVLKSLGVRNDVERDNPVFASGFDAILFDLDGTLVDSTASVVRSWSRLGAEFGMTEDLGEVVQTAQGMPARTLVRTLFEPAIQARALAYLTNLEISDASTVSALTGARELFCALPDSARAIVTSGSRRLAMQRLKAADIPVPDVLITSDDVISGKPHPEPFLRAASLLGYQPTTCLALEDTKAGITAAQAAGCTVIGVEGTSSAAELASASLRVDGLDRLRARFEKDSWYLSPAA